MYLSAHAITKSFQKGGRDIRVLRGLDLDLPTGSQACIVGRSGCGKSTLLQILGTLDRPDSGRINFDNINPFDEDEREIARIRNSRVGFVFQFHHLLPEFSALENVMMPAIIAEEPHKQILRRARDLLAEVGLAEREDHRPGELSGGEQQRVALARALVREPDLLLADEPLGNLDSETGESIGRLLIDAVERRGATLVVVTHERPFAERFDRVMELKNGIVQDLPRWSAPEEQGEAVL